MYSIIALLTLLTICKAQFRPNPFGSSMSNSTTYDVDVGKSGLTFEPSILHASVGDTINFHFWPSNHSVAESTFDKPCQPKSGGIDIHPIFSGFIPSKQSSSDTMFSMKVNTSDPVWLYCSQTEVDHCKNGQVMVINPL
jgi:plastocyanin